MTNESKLRAAAEIMGQMSRLAADLYSLTDDETSVTFYNLSADWSSAWAGLCMEDLYLAMGEAEAGLHEIADRDSRDPDELQDLLHARFFQSGPIEAVRDLVRRRAADQAPTYGPAAEIAKAFFREVFEDVIGRPWIDENPRVCQWNEAVVEEAANALAEKIDDSFDED